ncbi:hypothetical protein K523DRAFT_333927 [Schizophyllum commune Tattone D]|nr:hypothetical protein K523DRAFT_333927 [Schizophyllum commune Tattone D]
MFSFTSVIHLAYDPQHHQEQDERAQTVVAAVNDSVDSARQGRWQNERAETWCFTAVSDLEVHVGAPRAYLPLYASIAQHRLPSCSYLHPRPSRPSPVHFLPIDHVAAPPKKVTSSSNCEASSMIDCADRERATRVSDDCEKACLSAQACQHATAQHAAARKVQRKVKSAYQPVNPEILQQLSNYQATYIRTHHRNALTVNVSYREAFPPAEALFGAHACPDSEPFACPSTCPR